MRLWKAWIVTKRTLSIFTKKQIYLLFAHRHAIDFWHCNALTLRIYPKCRSKFSHTITSAELLTTASLFANISAMYLVLIAAILPSIIASYSFVGEKIEKSLEPLLATPTTDGELLLGKSLAAFVPCIAVTYLGAAISTAIIDYWSFTNLVFCCCLMYYWALVVFVIAPLACILSVEGNVIVSSQVNDIRAAQQVGSLITLPLILLVVVTAPNCNTAPTFQSH